MASNNSFSSNDALYANVRVKIEPGTSEPSMSEPSMSEPDMSEPSTSMSSVPSTSSAPSVPLSETVKIKMEPDLPTTTQRLTSFRLPRDLTLGGNIKTEKPKKVYIPNLNVQRNKKKNDPVVSVKTDPVRSKNSDRGKERGRGDRGRGKGDKRNIIQSVGVWSEGIHTTPTVRKSEGSRGSSSTVNSGKYVEKPKLNINKTTDKAEEDRRLKNLLRDDFIDDGPEEDEKVCPLMLPRVKKELHNIIDNKTDKKPIISKNDESINLEEEKQDRKEELTISQIIENKTNSYTLIQLPESLPGLKSSREETGNNASTSSEKDNTAKTDFCTLNNLRSGLLGKLEILKSGKARLRLGEMSFFVDIGAPQRFQQDLLAVKIDTASQTGNLINLGSVNNKLICSPDFESTLENS